MMIRLIAALNTARKSFTSALNATVTDATDTPAEQAETILGVRATTPEIIAAITEHESDRDIKNAADRRMKRTRKIIDSIADGIYGPFRVERVPSNRKNPDMDAIRKIFADNNLGEVPMIGQAPTLKVTYIAQNAAPVADNVTPLVRAA